MREVMNMDTDEYIKSKCDFNWSFEERKRKIEEILHDCPIQAMTYANVLSTDSYKFTLKKKTVKGKRMMYLCVEYPEQ